MGEGPTQISAAPGRPSISAAKKLKMQRDIAAAARQLFQDEGYAKISMRRIAAEIGCSPMTLYKYYDAKVDILRTLWGDVFAELFDRLDALPETADGRLQTFGLTYVQYWMDHPDYYRMVFISDGVTQSDVSVFIDSPELVQRFTLFSQALLNSFEENPDPDVLKAKLDAFICFLNGIAHNLITISGYPWSDPKEMVKMAVRAVTE